jgi:hypothetical protein
VILGHKACRTGGVTNTECPNVTVTEKGSGEADTFRFNPKEVSDSIRIVVQDKQARAETFVERGPPKRIT